jgi:hypothetical protein
VPASTGGTFSGAVTATSFIRSGGTTNQFLKADGSIDSSVYITAAALPTDFVPASTGGTFGGAITVNGALNAGLNTITGRTLNLGNSGAGGTNGSLNIYGFVSGEFWTFETGTNTLNLKDWQGNSLASFNGITNSVTLGGNTNISGVLTANTSQTGAWSVDSSYAFFGHKDLNTSGGYALLQAPNGVTVLNGVTNLYQRIGGADVLTLSITGINIIGNMGWTGVATGNGSGLTNVNATTVTVTSSADGSFYPITWNSGSQLYNSTTNYLTYRPSDGTLKFRWLQQGNGATYLGGDDSVYTTQQSSNASLGGFKFTNSGGITQGSLYWDTQGIGILNSTGDWLVQSTGANTTIHGNQGGGSPVIYARGTNGVGGGGRSIGISIQGMINDTGSVFSDLAVIYAYKENATHGDSRGGLSLNVNTGSGIAPALSFDSNRASYFANLAYFNSTNHYITWGGSGFGIANSIGNVYLQTNTGIRLSAHSTGVDVEGTFQSSSTADFRADSGTPNIRISGWDTIDWAVSALHFGGITTGQWNELKFYVNGSSTVGVNSSGYYGNGSGLTNVNASTLGGLSSSAFYLSSNPNGYTSNTGTVTSIVAGSNLTGGTITGSGTIALNPTLTSLTSASFSSTVTASDFIEGSDRRLKSNITKLTNGLSLLNEVNWVSYEKDGFLEFGVIAQEVREIKELSHIVKGDESKGMLGVSYGNFHAINGMAILEVDKKVETQQEKINRLETRVTELEQQLKL